MTEAAKSDAEELAYSHLTKLDALQEQLGLTEAAKSDAEELAHSHLTKLDALQEQLELTEAAKSAAEELAFQRSNEAAKCQEENEIISQDMQNLSNELIRATDIISNFRSSRIFKLLTTLRLVSDKDFS